MLCWVTALLLKSCWIGKFCRSQIKENGRISAGAKFQYSRTDDILKYIMSNWRVFINIFLHSVMQEAIISSQAQYYYIMKCILPGMKQKEEWRDMSLAYNLVVWMAGAFKCLQLTNPEFSWPWTVSYGTFIHWQCVVRCLQRRILPPTQIHNVVAIHIRGSAN